MFSLSVFFQTGCGECQTLKSVNAGPVLKLQPGMACPHQSDSTLHGPPAPPETPRKTQRKQCPTYASNVFRMPKLPCETCWKAPPETWPKPAATRTPRFRHFSALPFLLPPLPNGTAWKGNPRNGKLAWEDRVAVRLRVGLLSSLSVCILVQGLCEATHSRFL